MAFAGDNFDVLELQRLYKFAKERGLTRDQLNDILLNPSRDLERADIVSHLERMKVILKRLKSD